MRSRASLVAGTFAAASLLLAWLGHERPAHAIGVAGPLTKAHASLDGVSQASCAKCHDFSKNEKEVHCTDSGCHAEIKVEREGKTGLHGEVPSAHQKNCGVCHVEHLGRDFNLVDGKNPKSGLSAWGVVAEDPAGMRENFDHQLTGFPLKGAHAKMTCERCHTRKTKAGTPTFLGGGGKGCTEAGCHDKDDKHGFAAGSPFRDCELCHTLDDWKKRPSPMHFDHATTRFPLSGQHAPLAAGKDWTGCARCHTALPAFEHKERAPTCEECHKKDDPHRGAFGSRACITCHGSSGWKRIGLASAAHKQTFGKFDAKGAHASLACTKCHLAAKATLTGVAESDCAASGCHATPHPEKWTAKRSCGACHDVGKPRWEDLFVATRSHGEFSALTLTGKHLALACDSDRCHGKKAAVIPASHECVSCHAQDSRNDDAHKRPDHQICEKCHSTTEWKIAPGTGSSFDHLGATGFALAGGHASVACDRCHPGAGPGVTPQKVAAACSACHEKKSPHGGKLGPACETCHTTTAWKPSTFRLEAHNAKTGFVLSGKHASAACEACHKTQEFKGTPSECETCHPDDHHKGSRAMVDASGAKHTNCAACHVSDGWMEGIAKKVAGTLKNGELTRPSPGCISCHGAIEAFHPKGELVSCVGCHGGDGAARDKEHGHVTAPRSMRRKGIGVTSANPRAAFGDMEHADPAWIRFVNPGDLRVADKSCGTSGCHDDILRRVRTSIMATSANVPAAVLYNNGASASQAALYGEAFGPEGSPATLIAEPPPNAQQRAKGAVPRLSPLPRWDVTAAPDSFRIFERGNDAGGTRDRGTEAKIAGVFLNLVKTRLNDPALWLPGTNDSPGDYRASGCTACHVLYANDSVTANAAAIAGFGNSGHSSSADASIPKTEAGHPIRHSLTRSIPLSQCLTCHHHQGNGALGNYAGFVWHDQETEIDRLISLDALPGGSGQAQLASSNAKLEQAQFADSHGHQWNYRGVYWTDRRGAMLDAKGAAIAPSDRDKWAKAVHLKDIHLEKGMQCIDCHGERDAHGDGFLYTSMLDASEISCVDCHGTASAYAPLATRGSAAGSRSLLGDRTPFGQTVFTKRDGRIFQRSKMSPGVEWEVPQVKDVVTPGTPAYNAKGARAMGMRGASGKLAHDPAKMECYSCHSAWNLNCYGCHLPFDTNTRAKEKHRGDGDSFGYAAYNPQVIRTDAFTLGIDGDSLGNKVSPMRSASAVVVSATNANREVVVEQQPTVSSAGLSGDAMTPNVPHTVRAKQTKACSDCHPSESGDNNSILADRLGIGTNAANWLGDYAFVAAGSRIAGVRITEGDEPRPIIGSDFHRSLHPKSAAAFERKRRELSDAETAGASNARSIAVVGEFALVADGPRGLVVYDVANIANKGAAQKIVETPATRIGEHLRVDTKDAAWVAMPVTMPLIPSRESGPGRTEPKIAEMFRYAWVADRVQGLIAVDITTLNDGDPANNFLHEASAFNPDGALLGARHIAFDGNYALVSCDAGVAIVDVSMPPAPKLIKTVKVSEARAVAVEFRYAFVADADGVEVLDVTEPEYATLVPGARVALKDARGLVALRDWLYVANGRDGLAVIDITRAMSPRLSKSFDAGGEIHDATAVTVAATNASTFAFVADGAGGLRVVSLIEPSRVDGHLGFAPAPVPKLIATWKSRTPVYAVADGQKRDRFVDESGNAISVGGRIGARPFNRDEMRRLYIRDGKPYTVRDE